MATVTTRLVSCHPTTKSEPISTASRVVGTFWQEPTARRISNHVSFLPSSPGDQTSNHNQAWHVAGR